MAKDTGKELAFLGLIGLGGFLLTRLGRAKAVTKMENIRLSKNFWLSEFLSSTSVPELQNYKPSPSELRNLRLLVKNVLQPLRDYMGVPIAINSGGRPPHLKNKEGKTFREVLLERGFKPAEKSDHGVFAAADISMKVTSAGYLKAFRWLKKNAHVRQTILYWRTGKDGITRASSIHVATVYPGHGRIPEPNFAFAMKDGKRIEVE